MYDIGISNAIILSAYNNWQPFIGSIGVRGERFVYVGKEQITEKECKMFLDGSGKILMPGLVNAHCHGDMTLARGLGDDLNLAEQNQAFQGHNWFYQLINDQDRYHSRQLTYCEALLSGTTFIMENMYWGLGSDSVKAMAETGIRGALAEDIRWDFNNPEDLLSEEALIAFKQQCQEKGYIPVLGGISEEDYQSSLLERIEKKRSNLNMIETCHLAETTWRRKIVSDRFETTAIDYLYQNRVLGNQMIGSHVVYATDQEIEYLAETGTKVVNTPLCEMKIADGIAPIPQMVKAGVTVCLGTDGAMWNNSNDIFREMKGMSLLHTINSGIRSLTKKDILNMATIDGAKAFGIEADYGTVETGKKADFILIEANVPHMTPIRLGKFENITSHIIYNATGRDVTDVFIDGRQVVKDRRLETIDIMNLMKKVQMSAEKIVAEHEREEKL